MVIDHGEEIETLKQLHVNTVWVRSADEHAGAGGAPGAGHLRGRRSADRPGPGRAALGGGGPGDVLAATAHPKIRRHSGTWMSSQDREDVMARLEQLRYARLSPAASHADRRGRGRARLFAIRLDARHQPPRLRDVLHVQRLSQLADGAGRVSRTPAPISSPVSGRPKPFPR